jgi:transposase
MLNPGPGIKIYLATGHTDMRKNINGLSLIASELLPKTFTSGAMFVFRGRSADKIKILWYDGQGFCLFYKRLDSGNFIWLNSNSKASIGITQGQLSMLLEGIDWRNPTWSKPPSRAG